MKKLLLSVTSILAIGILFCQPAYTQCVPDTAFSGVGFTPNPLPDGCVGVAVDEIITFGLPADTVYLGVPLDFDSFRVNSIAGVPDSLDWECDAANCTYISGTGNITYGCVRVQGVPNDTIPSDTINISATAFITFLNNAVPLPQPIDIRWRVHPVGSPFAPCPTASVKSKFLPSLDLTIAPNPASYETTIKYYLLGEADIEATLIDLHGRVVQILDKGHRFQGEQEYLVDATGLPKGMYLVKLDIENGAIIQTKKLLIN